MAKTRAAEIDAALRQALEAARMADERAAEIDARALGDHGDALDRLLGRSRDREVIVDDGRHLLRQRLGAQIGGVIEQPRGDLAKRAVAGRAADLAVSR